MKSIIQYYNYYNSPVYTCFLDASKAFDRINHWTMFKQLILRDVPVLLIRLLCVWYRSQQLCILWGKTGSSLFTISNGVRQGGILSSKLFSVYMDYLSKLSNLVLVLVALLTTFALIMFFMRMIYVSWHLVQ